MKKNKKILIIIIIIIVILLLLVGIIVKVKSNNNNKEISSSSDFESVEEIAKYFNCEYKDMKKSSEDGFSKDIFLIWMKDPIDENGVTAKLAYEQVIRLISDKMNTENYRIIDEQRNLTVRVYFNEDKSINYTINNVTNYFSNIESAYSIKNAKGDKITDANITSNELKNIISNDWIRRKCNIGEKTSTCENYDIFWNRGYKTRTINDKIYNIVFTKNYQGQVLQGIGTGMKNEDVEKVLGEATYKEYTETDVIGYKLQNIYVFFADGEISVYRTDEFNEEDNSKFAELMTQFNNDLDYNNFLAKVTELYPDYSTYDQQSNYVILRYPLRGFEINFGTGFQSGITVYNNYQGKITTDINIEDVKNDKKLPNNTHLNLEKNLVLVDELKRIQNDLLTRNPYDYMPEYSNFLKTEKYTVYYIGTYNVYRFYSINRDDEDFELKVNNATGIYSIKDDIFAYGVANEGIYLVYANDKTSRKVIDSAGDCKITKIENNIIYFDDTAVDISSLINN